MGYIRAESDSGRNSGLPSKTALGHLSMASNLSSARTLPAGCKGTFSSLGFATGLSSYINYTSSEFGVTNRRVLIKVGFVRRRSLELFLQKLEGIGVDQGILGRIFGYGTITVTGTGGTKEVFRAIAAPLEFRRMVQQQTPD